MEIPVTLSFHREKPEVKNDIQNETSVLSKEATADLVVPAVMVTKNPIKLEVVDDTGISSIKNREYTKSMMISLLLVVIMFMVLYVMGMGVYYNS